MKSLRMNSDTGRVFPSLAHSPFVLSLLYLLADRLRHRIRLKRWSPDLATGRRGEDLAHRFLRRQGYTVVARNYRSGSGAGEIDIVAYEKEDLVFVEVKTRVSEEFGSPDRAVGPKKREHLERVARTYARQAGIEWGRAPFDIVNVLLTPSPRIELLRDAFRSGRTL
jgi:putative endonuclease